MPPCIRVPLVHAGVGAGEVAQINSALQAAGLPPDEIQNAIGAYTGLDQGCVDSIAALLDGAPVSLTTVGPLVAAGLAATGIGLPVVAVVAAALPILEGLASAIFGGSAPHCDWIIAPTIAPGGSAHSAGLCRSGRRPYGPQDPHWVTHDQFFQTSRPDWCQFYTPLYQKEFGNNFDLSDKPNCGGPSNSCTQLASFYWTDIPFGNLGHNADIDSAFYFYRYVIEYELDVLNAQGAVTGVPGFLRAYYKAWLANAEYAINGYKSAEDYALLTAVAASWNRVHQGPAMVLGPGPAPQWRSTLALNPNALGVYPALLMNGDVDNLDHAPIAVNAGKRIIRLSNVKTSGPNIAALQAAAQAKSSTPLSAPAKVAIGAGIVGGSAALGVGIWALATHQAYGAAWSRVWSGIKKPFKKR